jgi:predicted DsbA family dithiol-disulfide isomerase
MIPLDIISDPICPWCYIGWTNLARAMEARPDHPFAIEWHPFQLNPEMPEGGMDRREYLEHKFGGKDGAVTAYAPVVEHAERAGLTLNLDRIARTPNTIDAHRLIHWAGVEGRQTPVALGAFPSLFRRRARYRRSGHLARDRRRRGARRGDDRHASGGRRGCR